MSTLALGIGCLLALAGVAWVSWRAGHDTATRHADYTIATLRRHLRSTQADKQAETERATWLGRELMRQKNTTTKGA